MKNNKNYRLGFDIGGTFTDIVLYNTKKKEIYWWTRIDFKIQES